MNGGFNENQTQFFYVTIPIVLGLLTLAYQLTRDGIRFIRNKFRN
jgi:hypothetical protein